MTSRRRLVLAAALAPLSGVITLCVIAVALTVVSAPDMFRGEAFRRGLHVSSFLAFFGVPVAYGIMLVVGVPSFAILKYRGWLDVGPVIGIATASGAGCLPWIWQWFWGLGVDWMMVPIGAGAGFVAGTLFWMIGLRGSEFAPKGKGMKAG